MKLNQLKTKGFTLVEILIVVIIVGLLAGIAVSKLGDSKELAVAAVKKSAAAEMNKAIQSAYVKGDIFNTAPSTVAGLVGTYVGGVYTPPTTDHVSKQFTQSSLQEMIQNVNDTTPNSGQVTVTGATHKDLEVLYTPGNP